MKNSYRENTPNAGKLIYSLRNTGYNNISAIADLVDNSIDAGAKNIWLNIEPIPKDYRIILADDGTGMNEQILDQAMRLGSDTERDTGSDLGKFGMGMITASISIGQRLTVITRQEKETLVSTQDLEEIARTGNFIKELRPATAEERAIFDKEAHGANHGTVLIIEKCDRLQNKNINELCKHITDQLGQIFRMFLKSGSRSVYVRGDKISAVDPLWLDHEGTEEFSDETFGIDVDGHSESVRVRIVSLPEFDAQTNKRHGFNIRNQGFYLIRNNREIAAGEDLGLFSKHNDLNRLRIEIFFSANLDDAMGVNFTKRDIKPTKSILDKINQITSPQIVSFRKRIKASKAAKDSPNIDHTSSATTITAKSNTLITPPIKYTPRTQDGGHHGTNTPTGTGSLKGGEGAEKSSAGSRMNCEFLLRSQGSSGNLFDMEQVGKKVIVYYNIDHPFYQEFIAINKDNKEIVNTIDFLIYSLASAQLINMNQDNQILFDNFNSIFSSNLRTLIS